LCGASIFKIYNPDPVDVRSLYGEIMRNSKNFSKEIINILKTREIDFYKVFEKEQVQRVI
jgi:hypothetical protein